jgi:hypothetical protein
MAQGSGLSSTFDSGDAVNVQAHSLNVGIRFVKAEGRDAESHEGPCVLVALRRVIKVACSTVCAVVPASDEDPSAGLGEEERITRWDRECRDYAHGCIFGRRRGIACH